MKVSIIIPVYNSGLYLKNTLTSAIAQTWTNKEIIVVDDGSSDDSIKIARHFEAAYQEVNVFAQPNGGACKARNFGLAQSTGDFIQFLDADDLLSADKITSQMKFVSSVDSSRVLSCPWVRFYRDDEISSAHPVLRYLDRSWDDPVEWLINAWEGKGMGQTSIWLTSRSLLDQAGPWNEKLSINQDGEFFSRVLSVASGITFCPDSLVYYRSGIASSISQKIDIRKASDLLYSYECYEENILSRENSKRVRSALARNYITFMYTYHDDYPELAARAKKNVFRLGESLRSVAGGRNFRRFGSLIGFENALRLRSLWRKTGIR